MCELAFLVPWESVLGRSLLYYSVSIHFPCPKHEQQFLFILIHFSDPPLILDTFVGPNSTILILLLTWHCKKYVFQNQCIPYNYRCRKKKRKNIFLVWCAGVAIFGCFPVVSVRLLVVCSHLLVVCGRF